MMESRGGVMARRGRRAAEVVLSGEERETLERWARRPTSAQALTQRCRIVLAAATGEANGEIAARLGCHPTTVGKWRGRFAKRGLDGLHDEPRPGKPRTISDDDVERVITKTLEETPANATHWSTRSMAAQVGMSQSAVSRIWRAFGLKPHQLESFTRSRATLDSDPVLQSHVLRIPSIAVTDPREAQSDGSVSCAACACASGTEPPAPCRAAGPGPPR
jgi:transposase